LQDQAADEQRITDAVLPVAVSIMELVLAWCRRERKEGGSLEGRGGFPPSIYAYLYP
jgi:hypothetical protein